MAEALRVRGRRPEALAHLATAAAIVDHRLGATSARARRLAAQAQRLRDA